MRGEIFLLESQYVLTNHKIVVSRCILTADTNAVEFLACSPPTRAFNSLKRCKSDFTSVKPGHKFCTYNRRQREKISTQNNVVVDLLTRRLYRWKESRQGWCEATIGKKKRCRIEKGPKKMNSGNAGGNAVFNLTFIVDLIRSEIFWRKRKSCISVVPPSRTTKRLRFSFSLFFPLLPASFLSLYFSRLFIRVCIVQSIS